MLLLERLSDAQRRGHPVLAVDARLGGQPGRPEPGADRAERARAGARDPSRRSAHARAVCRPTSTSSRRTARARALGDPIEAQALLATYGQGALARAAAAGSARSSRTSATRRRPPASAGVIKMVLAMQHGVLPKTLHAETPSPHVDWSAGTVRLLTEDAAPGRAGGRPRRAAVSSFGISGTNAHVILEEAPAARTARRDRRRRARLRSRCRSCCRPGAQAALRAPGGAGCASTSRPTPSSRSPTSPHSLAHDARALRAARGDRRAAIATSCSRRSTALGDGRPRRARRCARKRAVDGKLVFVFPGQGAQWARMARGAARELRRSSASRSSRARARSRRTSTGRCWRCCAASPDAPTLERVDVVQPALFAVMVSLAALWRSLGVEPDAVVGHSQGEIAAAYVAGALTLEDAAQRRRAAQPR